MTSGSPGEESSGDYSYDMAHDETAVNAAPSTGTEPASPPVVVATETPADQDRDYSYDMAHDIPRDDA